MSTVFDPKFFLQIARDTSNKPTLTEAEARMAVGRAYYSCCFRVEAHRRAPELATGIEGPQNDATHQRNIDFIRQSNEAKAQAIADELVTLRTLRHAADYPRNTVRLAHVMKGRTWLKVAQDAVGKATKIHHWLDTNLK